MSSGGNARVYARALLELANENEGGTRWQAELQRIAELFANREARNLFESKTVPLPRKLATAAKLLENLPPLLNNFVKLTIMNSETPILADMANHFAALASESADTTQVRVYSAFDLTPQQVGQLEKALPRRLGVNKVAISTHIDPAVIGGITVRAGDKLWDGSIRNQLGKLRASLLES